MNYQLVAQNFLYAVKTGQEPTEYMSQLAALDENLLITSLPDDATKKAFWLNVYNGYVQVLLKKCPEKFSNRNAFFTAEQVEVAGHKLSLDFIEHGVLRRSKSKVSMGYFNKLFTADVEKNWRVDLVDYRIHFALNCGARSCPPIAFYTAEKINTQLDMATRTYLTSEVTFDRASQTVTVPKLMSWFRADFGGKDGIRKILSKLEIIPEGSKPRIDYKEYDWTLLLQQYKEQG